MNDKLGGGAAGRRQIMGSDKAGWAVTASLVLAVVFSVMMAGTAFAQDFRFSRFVVEGNQRVDASTVLSYADLQTGEVLSAADLNTAFQDILASGLFETVSLDPQGSTLVITVEEWPTINRISIEGNRRLDDEDLLRLVRSSPRRVYSPTTAEADADAIVTAYETQGYLAATVEPRIIRRSDNRVDLVFEIREGRVVENERVTFIGNRSYSERRLRRVLETKQANFLRSIVGRDSFVADRIEFDRQLLTDFYRARGFVDFEVLSVSTELSRERNATFITFNLREGQSYDFGRITVSSDLPDIDTERYLDEIRIRPGRTYTPVAVDNTITRLELLALREGRDFIRVEPRVTRNDAALTLDFEFNVTRGERVFVERIDIEGNQTTLDRVIRRQFRIVEGDPFNPREIRAASERIRALNYFADVQVASREGSAPDQVVIDVDVEERATGSLGFGASFSSDTGAGLTLSFSESNFLGRGQSLSFDINTTKDSGNSQITFVEPAFLGRDLALSLSAFLITSDTNNAEFSTERLGGRVALGFAAGEDRRLQLRYEISQDEVLGVNSNSSPIIQAEEGTKVASSIGYTYTYDSRISGLNPNAGVLLSFGQDFAGVGGDVEYIKTTARAVAQTRVLNEEVTLRATLEGGNLSTLGGDVSRLTDRFFLSSRQLRGFDFRGVGPRDLDAVNEDALGGNNYVSARFEVDFPIGFAEDVGISGGLFLDAGTVWGLDNTNGAGGVGSVDDGFSLRSAIGFSLFWETPIGPLTFNFSRPIKDEPFDVPRNFDIAITARF
ncbi:MAG: outer membrane protein assembly factor BamA [Rhodobacteraceae bacterium]|nr:outer membrane protein assembly factor BamA [Paracoccaceae bacterium]